MSILIYNNAAVKDSCIFVKFPAGEIVSHTCIVVSSTATLCQADTSTAEIVMEGVSQTERFVFLQFPARMVSADVVCDVAGKESVLSSLNLLL